MRIIRTSPALIGAALLLSGPVAAQTAATTSNHATVAAKASNSTTTKAPVVRTAKSLDCSKQADAKSLHGKPRKSFMSSCKKA